MGKDMFCNGLLIEFLRLIRDILGSFSSENLGQIQCKIYKVELDRSSVRLGGNIVLLWSLGKYSNTMAVFGVLFLFN